MSLTCISCKLLFSVPQLHLDHYKSEWHRYNLKRRIADLPAVTLEEFEKRVSAFKEDAVGTDKKVSLHCEVCKRHFSTQNAMTNHLQSKKHLDLESGVVTKTKKKLPPPRKRKIPKVEEDKEMEVEDEEMEEDDEEDWESCEEGDEDEDNVQITVETNDCLFCDHQSDTIEDNVSHMTVAHSFFIPDMQYVQDLDGIIATLAAKIILGHICLWCNGKGKSFKSAKSVRKHMIDKGHTKMLYEGDVVLDYADFYDYSELDEDGGGDIAKIGELLEDASYELVLPSGATIGHRSLAVYYKQNLKPINSDSRQKVKRVLQQYKALGYTGCTGTADVKKAKDIAYMQRIKNKFYLKIGQKANKFQPHFRPQVLF